MGEVNERILEYSIGYSGLHGSAINDVWNSRAIGSTHHAFVKSRVSQLTSDESSTSTLNYIILVASPIHV